ncbi:MAG: ABC transporter permease [Solirubrobacterales bacterium]|nr:ABC transporter permease [Solirubrobacterales bacterium]
MNFRFFFSEALRTLRRNSAPSIAAFLTVMVTTLVLGVFIPITNIATGAANDVRSRLMVEVFIADAATNAEVNALKGRLESSPYVKTVTYVSKAEAQDSLEGTLKDASKLLGENPLPASFQVTPKDPDEVNAIVQSLTRSASTNRNKPSYVSPAIDEVQNREDQTQKILTITGGVKFAMWGLAILLVLTSALLVGNTIRLSIYARRREVEVMRMVGATSWFIRWPFVIEGIFVGAAGGLFAVLMLLIFKQTVIDPVSEKFALFAAPDTINFWTLTLVLMLSAVLISALGSGMTLRRFLRV